MEAEIFEKEDAMRAMDLGFLRSCCLQRLVLRAFAASRVGVSAAKAHGEPEQVTAKHHLYFRQPLLLTDSGNNPQCKSSSFRKQPHGLQWHFS